MKKYILMIAVLCLLLTGCTADEAPQMNTPKARGASAPSDINGTLEVHYIDVGQGDATLIKTDSHAMLIDGGNNHMGTTVQMYLKNQGVESLDYMIGTHPDADHIGGLDVIAYKYECGKVIMPGCEKDTKTYEELIQVIRDKNMSIISPKAGDVYELGGARFTIIAPVSDDYGSNANEYSVAVLLEYGESRFLFTGDVEEKSETEMLSNGIELTADVYKVSHHGSGSASTQEFLEEVQPKYAVISCGEGNTYGHPHSETLNRLRGMGVKVFRTDEQGSVVAVSDGKEITWNCPPTESWQAGERMESDREDGYHIRDVKKSAPSDKRKYGTEKSEITYILNTNTKKFHREGCRSIRQIKEKNCQETAMNREELQGQGYEPCKNCNP